jgi:puromycin-sensitive aminopeptidase
LPSEADYRLPRTVVPSHYALRLEPDLTSARFAGNVVVEVEIAEPVGEVIVNALDLEIEEVVLVDGSGHAISAASLLDPETERAIFTLEREADPGTGRLEVRFGGELNDKLFGFYRSTYTDASGEEKTVATTQMEDTHARRAFPCWDEPDLKATFDVTLVVDEDLLAVSNAHEVSRTAVGDGKVAVEFATTMKMSTYLLAFVVGDLVATEPVDVDGVPLRIVHQRGQEGLTGFALEAGSFCLRFFSDYYGIPYPGTKLDMIAIPDFAWGAMENLGAITYRETALLVDPELATTGDTMRVAEVVAHEIAHMWFGDLVTMKWWNGIWLNEAFATFAEVKCIDAFRKEWKLWLSFQGSRVGSMETDALTTTRPVEFAVAKPAEATEMFDVLTYQKGSAVLRMLEQYLGEETFRAGVSHYLETHAYANTETVDLWNALEEISGEPVAEMMDGWIFQGGFPLVSVDKTDTGYSLSQRHFQYLDRGDQMWSVPVLFRSTDGDGRVLLSGESVSIEAGSDLVINAGASGFYRTQYVGELLDDLAGRLQELAPEERFTVVSDTFAAVLAGSKSGADYLSLIERLGDEQEVDVWNVALSGVAELDRVISSDRRGRLQEFVRDLTGDKADELGWAPGPDEDDRTRQLRGLLIRSMGNLGDDPETKHQARAIVEQAAADPSSVDNEVGDAALAVVAGNGTMEDFDEFLRRSSEADTPQDVVRFLRLAAAVPERAAAESMFAKILAGEIRRQDSFWLLALLLGHRENGPRIWELIKENWDAVLEAVPPGTERRILDLVPRRSEPDVAADLEAWLIEHPVPQGGKAVAQKLESMNVRVGLREREGERLFD